MLLFDLLARGYFPKELPPPFATDAFAEFIVNRKISDFKPQRSRAIRYNLARPGNLRRLLQIPNPINQPVPIMRSVI